ncbi:MAG: hypothetical protein RL885_13655 [Planctomycetota bacterium]
MHQTRVRLLKFACDKCSYECFVNENNNALTHSDQNLGALLDWRCPECEPGRLRYATINSKFVYNLVKKDRDEAGSDDDDGKD